MNVREILIQWLKEHGYSALINTDGECGCGLDDLIVCESACDECEPAYKHEPDECRACDREDYCPCKEEPSFGGYCKRSKNDICHAPATREPGDPGKEKTSDEA